MIRDFSREELEPATSNDTELTLGVGTVLGLGAGLLLLCIVCFALGYFVGHRSRSNETAAVVLPDSAPALSAKPGSKPGAVRQLATTPPSDAITSSTDAQLATASDGASSAQPASTTGPQVRPALQSSNSAHSDAPLHVQPATSEVQGWMVQIAAVSRTEDADVLIGALKKRGYAVTARRELGDNLIHVQTGPFTSRNDANAMRQKLLNDGYNAIVQ